MPRSKLTKRTFKSFDEYMASVYPKDCLGKCFDESCDIEDLSKAIVADVLESHAALLSGSGRDDRCKQ